LALTTLYNYALAQKIHLAKGHAGRWLALTVALNIGILAGFIHYNWLVGFVNYRFWDDRLPYLYEPPISLVTLVGLSFFTFQALSYPLDVYYQRAPLAKNLLHFACFTAFFPTLLSGPVARWAQLGGALGEGAVAKKELFYDGLGFFLLGMMKKFFIADVLLQQVVWPLRASDDRGFFLSWLLILAYTLQLYVDFWAYSDMAIGLGRFLGFSLPRNFNHPYQAQNVADFWERWHMSLSSWFRDYLFFPLSRALLRRSKRRYPRLIRAATHLLTMLLIGLWHGSGWTFLLWGGYHGILLVIYYEWRERDFHLPSLIARPLTLFSVILGWVFFQSASLGEAFGLLQGLVGLKGWESWAQIYPLVGIDLLLFTGLIFVWTQLRQGDIFPQAIRRSPQGVFGLGLGLAWFILWLAGGAEAVPFVYFQF
jgi:alginate O-acetyltransferase complex protein AlgI